MTKEKWEPARVEVYKPGSAVEIYTVYLGDLQIREFFLGDERVPVELQAKTMAGEMRNKMNSYLRAEAEKLIKRTAEECFKIFKKYQNPYDAEHIIRAEFGLEKAGRERDDEKEG